VDEDELAALGDDLRRNRRRVHRLLGAVDGDDDAAVLDGDGTSHLDSTVGPPA
jgi:hypothetical protein